MSGVVLRCPHCGTTRATLGECEACHEADVRHYCTNHNPGVWLDGPVCKGCGAKLGDAPKPMVAPPSPRRKPPADTPRTEGASRWPGPWTRRRRMPFPADERPSDPSGGSLDVRPADWTDILREAALRARRRPPARPPELEPISAGAVLGGCFLRSLMLLFFMFMLFAFMSFFVGNVVFQGF
jgi:hypothetical protein